MSPVLLNNLLWVMQGFLALTFLIAGSAKLFGSAQQVAQLVPAAFPLPFLRRLGVLEVLGAIGIVLPLAIDVLPALTLVTACCMGVVLLAAILVHLKAKQFVKLPMLLLLLTLTITVTFGRYFVIVSTKPGLQTHDHAL